MSTYDIIIRGRIEGLIQVLPVPPATNNPPVWSQQPNPIFTQGTGSSYDVGALGSDPDEDALTYSLNTGAVSLPTGVTWTAGTGVLTYDGAGAVASTSGHVATLDDGTDTVDSDAFEVSIASAAYPLLAQYRIGGSRVYAEDNSTGESQRAALAKLDCVALALFPAGGWDTGGAGWLTRAEVITDLKTRNPNLIIFDYTNVMELNRTESPTNVGDLLDWLYDTTGFSSSPGWVSFTGERTPPSIGSSVNDHWGRKGSGEQKSTFGGGEIINTNICPDFTETDGSGDRYPQVYADDVQTRMIQTHIDDGEGVGPDGINIMSDVMDIRCKSGQLDFNGDGSGDDARDNYDPEDPGHVNPGLATAGSWRQGHRDFGDDLTTRNAGMYFIGNLTTWFRDWASTDPSPYKVMPEYQDGGEYTAFLHGGIQEEVATNRTEWSITGVHADGTRVTSNSYGTWQKVLNAQTYLMDVCQDPRYVMVDWHVECATQLANSPQNQTVWDSVPHASSYFHLMRWATCTTLLNNGYLCLSPIEFGTTSQAQFKSTVHFDEWGTINTGTTGLSKGWLGNPVDSPVTTPFSGNEPHALYKREFDNGLVIVNSSKNNNLTVAVADIGGAGVWKRIDGVQDSSHNDGTTVNADFTLNLIDGIILERI